MQNVNQETILQDMFLKALNEPGKLADYYGYFKNYSYMNMLLLWFQGANSPVATYKRWLELGRQVKKGAKAKGIWIPSSRKAKREIDGVEEEYSYLTFRFVNCIFELNDTDGVNIYSPEIMIPQFDKASLLQNLGITETPFKGLKGNVQGYAMPNSKNLSINPLAKYPHKTMLHEIAHCLLHERDHEGLVTHDGVSIPRDIREVEAEGTALLAGSFLGIFTEEEKSFSRGYIQGWLKNNELPEKTCKRVFKAVNLILEALGHGKDEENEKAA